MTSLLRARNAVGLVFGLNGFAFASWAARIPESRTALDLTPAALGTLLLAIALGSLVALPAAGPVVQRVGAGRVVASGAALDGVGLALAGAGVGLGQVWVTAAGLVVFGVGTGAWDVAMNVEGAAVERGLRRSIMPRFHAGFSLGTVAGAGAGAATSALSVPISVHLAVTAAAVATSAVALTRLFLPRSREVDPTDDGAPAPRHPLRAWTEPRTLVLGVLVLAMAFTEGTAYDWLAVALVDGYDVVPALGAVGFALFVTAMTAGRLFGTHLLDRLGRTTSLRLSMLLAGVGTALVVFGGWLPLVALGILVWGLGASLGFPVGMSAAADDPEHAAGRVGVVSSIGYTAFLAGPPLIGFVAEAVGPLRALLLVTVLLVPSLLAVGAARPLNVAARDAG